MTRINRLVLDGFKSFGKFTELRFDKPFSTVIGPNGSGKSNILDGLCFVLGKSSSKSLRAEKSANLIYNGGKTKKPAKQAEVSIYFDNSNKTFPIEDDELKLTRLVRHDGVSKYLINGKTRTRQEVIEMLSVAKIDPDGYNIILQGDIVNLVEMSPIERRQIIEEIAGISVYEEKKQKALNELQKVEEKLGEAEIVLKERETYLKDLRKDRDQALKYKEINDKIKSYKATHIEKQLSAKQKEHKSFEEKKQSHQEQLEKINNAIQKIRDEIKERKESIKKINEEIEQKGEVEQIKLQKEIEQLRVDIATAQTNKKNSLDELSKLDQRKQQLDLNTKDLEQKYNELLAQKKAVEETKKAVKKDSGVLEKGLADFKKKHKLDESHSIEEEISRIDLESEELQKKIQELRENQQNLLREKDKCEFQLSVIDQKIAKLRVLEKEHKQELDDLKKQKVEFKNIVLELNKLLNQDSEDARSLAIAREKCLDKQQELSRLEVRHTHVQEAIAGNIAVKKVLENKKRLGLIYGTVSELGEVEKKYALALEIAAAQKIQSIVVEDDKTAVNGIKFLKSNKLGIAAFLPLNKIKPYPVKPEIKELAKKQGVYGLAIDLIKFDNKFKDIFSYVFGNTLVVGDIETARKLGIGKAKMVSLEGDIAELSGVMIGGYRHQKSGSFKEKDIGRILETAKEEVENLGKTIEDLEITRKENDEKIIKLREQKAILEGEVIKKEKALHLHTEDLEADQQYKEDLIKNIKKFDEELSLEAVKISSVVKDLTELKIKKEKLRSQIFEIRKPTVIAELNAFEGKRKKLQEDLIKLEAEQNSFTLQEKEIFEKEKQNTERLYKDIEKERDYFSKQKEELAKKINENVELLKIKEKDQTMFFSQYKGLFDVRNKLQDEINSIENNVLSFEEKSRKEELALQSFSIENARIKSEISGLEAELSNYEGVQLVENKSIEELKKSIQNMERSISSIGNVNMRALEIYETVEQEYTNLLQKKESLHTEKEQVLNFMQEIEVNKKEIFMKTFEVINKNFQDIFLQLSTKGESYLELENQEKIFEEGLRIKVRLTGDKFLDIRSLSGGEKTMTALAFLFAIQEHEPASFYILDEVDAALDKQNSSLLARLIRKYCDKAQYVVISHNDNVISEADILYGVSMKSGEGASSIVSLKI